MASILHRNAPNAARQFPKFFLAGFANAHSLRMLEILREELSQKGRYSIISEEWKTNSSPGESDI